LLVRTGKEEDGGVIGSMDGFDRMIPLKRQYVSGINKVFNGLIYQKLILEC